MLEPEKMQNLEEYVNNLARHNKNFRKVKQYTINAIHFSQEVARLEASVAERDYRDSMSYNLNREPLLKKDLDVIKRIRDNYLDSTKSTALDSETLKKLNNALDDKLKGLKSKGYSEDVQGISVLDILYEEAKNIQKQYVDNVLKSKEYKAWHAKWQMYNQLIQQVDNLANELSTYRTKKGFKPNHPLDTIKNNLVRLKEELVQQKEQGKDITVSNLNALSDSIRALEYKKVVKYLPQLSGIKQLINSIAKAWGWQEPFKKTTERIAEKAEKQFMQYSKTHKLLDRVIPVPVPNPPTHAPNLQTEQPRAIAAPSPPLEPYHEEAAPGGKNKKGGIGIGAHQPNDIAPTPISDKSSKLSTKRP